jgi:hypothetical protein
MEHLGYHWTDIHEIVQWVTFRKSVEEFQMPLTSDKDDGYFKWRPLYILGNIFFNTSNNVNRFRQIFRRNLTHIWNAFYRKLRFFDVTTSYNSVDRAAWLGKVTSQRHACRTGNKMAASTVAMATEKKQRCHVNVFSGTVVNWTCCVFVVYMKDPSVATHCIWQYNAMHVLYILDN